MTNKIRKVLIIRFSSIGDIVLTTPVPRCIKTQFPDMEVHYCTKKAFRTLVENNPYIDKVYTLESGLKELISKLKAENYDFIIDLHRNIRTKLIKLVLRKPSSSFDKLNYEKWLYVNLRINKLPNVHIVDRYLNAAKPLNVKNDNLGLDYFIPEKDQVELDWLPFEFHKGFVALVIGATYFTKKLPYEKLIELCDRIAKPIVLIGGKEDFEMGEKLTRFFEKRESSAPYEEKLTELGKKSVLFNACGKFNLNQSADLIKKATHVFSHDTGMMHVAAAFRKNTFSIWGNTIPQFGMYPYKTKFTIFENNKISCRPCSKLGYHKCPKKHFRCMKDIVFDFYLPE